MSTAVPAWSIMPDLVMTILIVRVLSWAAFLDLLGAHFFVTSRLCSPLHTDLQVLEALPAVMTEDPHPTCRYYEDVAQADVSAILNHHAHIEDIDVSALSALLDSEQPDGAPQTSALPGKKKGSVGCAGCQALPLCCVHPMHTNSLPVSCVPGTAMGQTLRPTHVQYATSWNEVSAGF